MVAHTHTYTCLLILPHLRPPFWRYGCPAVDNALPCFALHAKLLHRSSSEIGGDKGKAAPIGGGGGARQSSPTDGPEHRGRGGWPREAPY